MLCQLNPEFTGISSAALWDDSKLGLANWKAWERLVVVTDVYRVVHAARLFAFLIPGLVKVFSNEARADAEKWVAA